MPAALIVGPCYIELSHRVCMSVQILLQGRMFGSDEFLVAGTPDEIELIGRAHWVTLLSEVLPRALIAELNRRPASPSVRANTVGRSVQDLPPRWMPSRSRDTRLCRTMATSPPPYPCLQRAPRAHGYGGSCAAMSIISESGFAAFTPSRST